MSTCKENATLSMLEYIRYLKESASKSEKQAILSELLKSSLSHSFASSQIELSRTPLPVVDDSELTTERVLNFSQQMRHLKDDTFFDDFMQKLSALKYFRGFEAGEVGYLNRYMAATYAFYQKVYGRKEDDLVYLETLAVLTGKQVTELQKELKQATTTASSGDDTDGERESVDSADGSSVSDVGGILKSASIWDDIDITLLKPAKFVVVDEVTSLVRDDVNQIQNALNAKAQKGPNLGFTFLLFSASFVGMFAVAMNHSVAEKPVLFRFLWALAYLMNVYAVCLPGRLDRMFVGGNHLKPWHSLFEPSQWGFAIWAVIYAAQLCLTMFVAAVGIPQPIFQFAVPYWLAANWFCVLWCFCFRAEFMHHLWVPLLCLIGAATCFSLAHVQMTLEMANYSYTMRWIITLLRLPMGMHAAWMLSAIFITLNSWVAVSEGSKGLQVAMSFASAFIAAVIGLVYSIWARDITIALVVAWALDACACRTLEKAHVPQSFVSQEIHEALSITESLLSNGLKIVALGIAVLPMLSTLRDALPELPDL